MERDQPADSSGRSPIFSQVLEFNMLADDAEESGKEYAFLVLCIRRELSVAASGGGGIDGKPSAGEEGHMNNYTKRSLEELNLLDDFLMEAVASNEEYGAEFCRIILSTFLNREIGEVRVVTQRAIPAFTPQLRGIRMDVEAVEAVNRPGQELPAVNVYDIEPHIPRDTDIPRRNRFYQAKVDGRLMAGGTPEFSKMPSLYVLMITPYDLFGYGYMMYTVKNQCMEVPELHYEDGLQFIYLNPVGTKGGNARIWQMLQYFRDSREDNVRNDTLKKIHDYVNRTKVLPEVKKDFMKFEEIIYYERKEAAEEAKRRTVLDNIYGFLEDCGEIPEELRERMEQEENTEILKKWLKLAARAESIGQFEEQMGNVK